MTQRLRRILIMIVMALLTVTLMAASLLCSVTYARYAGGKFNEEKSIYDQIIEFVGANQYEVYSPEELVEAIENGYSYIKIGKGAEEPFVITTGVTDVTANLVIDLNGTTIVRNSRNPVLDVQRNVSAVLVFDSSVEEGGDVAKDAGSFYNPVGSALQVSGGTLTVAAGRYDSGPKDGIADAFTAGNATSFKLFKRNGSRADDKGYTAVTGDSAQGQVTMPALTADVYIPQNVSSGYNFIEDDTYLIYSEEQNCYESGDSLIVNAVKDENGSFVGDALAVPCNAASCDFYYYYPIDEDGNPIKTDGTASAPQTYAVIYGYNDVKALAANDALDGTDLSKNGLVWPYAAVRSIRSTETVQEGEGRTTGGEGFMRGGAFSTYFGTENTYGIYAEGGTLSVADGVSFTAVGEGVCIRSQTSSTTTDSNAAASLEISGGTFSSELGDTIQMEGGSVTITGGTFTKNADVVGAQTPETVPEGTTPNNGSAIDIQGGTLKVNEKDTIAAATKSVIFNVTGDYVNGIKMTKEETATQSDVIKNATFNFNQTRGGTSVAAIQVAGGTLEVSGSIFNFNREASSNTAFSHNNGIYVRSSGEGDAAQSGTVTATNCTFNFGNNTNSSVTASAGIASVGGEVTAKNCTFTLPGYSNYGIYATGGETTVTGGSITMTGRDTTQIGSGENAARGNDNFGINISGGEVTANGCTITITGTYSAGVLARGGTVNLGSIKDDVKTIQTTIYIYLSSVENETITTLSSSAVSSESVTNTDNSVTEGIINITGDITIDSNSLGITARGTVNVNSGVAKVKTLRATGVYVNNGTLNVKAGATLDVTSTIAQGCTWVQPPEGQTEIPPSIYNGVYVNGGSLTSNGTLNVDFTGVQSDNVGNGDNENVASGTAYRDFQVKSYAVRVESSNTTEDDGTQTDTVTIAAGDITNSIGGGVLVNGGVVTLGAVNENNVLLSAPTVSATAKEGEAEASDVYYTERSVVAATGVEADYNWRYAPPRLGGDAVKVVNGELTIYGGSYSARHGNGILVSNGEAEVEGGTFSGNDVRNDNKTSDYLTGAGSSFGFKLLGGTLTINGGTFSSGGGGAFVMEGTLNFVSGTVLAQGPTGISAWENATVYFGGTDEGASTDAVVEVHANSTGIAVETRTQNAPNITVYSGTFTGGINYPNYGITRPSTGSFDGIWYGNNAAVLKISGGTFQGYNRAGLFIAGNPGSNIQISGGTFEATNSGGAISGSSPGSVSTHNIIASGSWCFDGEGYANENALCTWTGGDYEYNGRWYHYYQVGGDNSVALNNGNVYTVRNDRVAAINAREKIEVKQGDQKVFDYFDPY